MMEHVQKGFLLLELVVAFAFIFVSFLVGLKVQASMHKSVQTIHVINKQINGRMQAQDARSTFLHRIITYARDMQGDEHAVSLSVVRAAAVLDEANEYELIEWKGDEK